LTDRAKRIEPNGGAQAEYIEPNGKQRRERHNGDNNHEDIAITANIVMVGEAGPRPVGVGIRYRPDALTSEYIRRLDRAGFDAKMVANMAAEVLTFADIEDGQGNNIPTDGDTLYRKMPFKVLCSFLDAMQEDQSPPKRVEDALVRLLCGDKQRRVSKKDSAAQAKWLAKYRLCRAAKWLGVAPWELLKQPLEWQEMALCFERSEGRAEEVRIRRARQKAEAEARRRK